MIFVQTGPQSKRRCYDLYIQENSYLDVYTGADDWRNGLPRYYVDNFRSDNTAEQPKREHSYSHHREKAKYYKILLHTWRICNERRADII